MLRTYHVLLPLLRRGNTLLSKTRYLQSWPLLEKTEDKLQINYKASNSDGDRKEVKAEEIQ